VACALVVDDSPASARTVATELIQAGYFPVHVATDWAECRAALAKDPPPDLVVLDVQMVGMVNGDVMAMQLKRNPRCSGARFVLHSGLSLRDLEAMAKRCGADAFLQKSSQSKLAETCKALVPIAPPTP
jgi:CheY-like chemotaxis protein